MKTYASRDEWNKRATHCPVKIDTTEDGDVVMLVDYCTNDWKSAVECAKRKQGVIKNIGGIYQVVFKEVWDAFTHHQVMEAHRFAVDQDQLDQQGMNETNEFNECNIFHNPNMF